MDDVFSCVRLLTMALQPCVGPWLCRQLRNVFTQTVGLLRRAMSPSQGRYILAHTHTHTYTHALSGIGTHDVNVRAGEDSSCHRPRAHCARRVYLCIIYNYQFRNTGVILAVFFLFWIRIISNFAYKVRLY
jgi:hypothetical protein